MPVIALSGAALVTNRGGAVPTVRTKAIATISFLGAIASMLLAIALAAVNRPSLGTAIGSVGVSASVATSFATAGLIIQLRRPNTVGALLLSEGVLAGTNVLAQQYAWLALITTRRSLPLGDLAAWLSLWTFVPMVALIAAGLPLVFPRWRPGSLERLAGVAATTGAVLLSVAIAFGPASDFSLPGIANPYEAPSLTPILGPAGGLGLVLLVAGVGLGITSLVRRYRTAPGIERQQLKWFAYGTVLAALAVTVPMLLYAAGRPLSPAVFGLLQMAAFPLLPLSIAVAIARRRLYDIDRLISRSLLYALLTAVIAGVYLIAAAAVGLVASSRSAWPAVAGVAAAIAALEIGRGRLKRAVDRLLYGERGSPQEALARLSRRLEESDSTLEVVVAEVARSLRLPTAAMWLVDGSELTLGAAYGGRAARVGDAQAIDALTKARGPLATTGLPAGPLTAQLEGLGAEIVLPLRHSGQLVGVLALAPRDPGEAFNSADFDLLAGLASQAAGAALSAQLSGRLQKARESLVLAQDEERRRIQRDLHDELGPTLASVRMRIGALLAEDAPGRLRSELLDLDEVVANAAGGVRSMVHDLRPLALEQLGLAAALVQLADRFRRDTQMSLALELPPNLTVPAAVEVAVYRIVQEALHNAHRHGHATSTAVRVACDTRGLTLEVEDDGSGLAGPPGSGIVGMRERVDELGGTFSIRRRDGTPGTVVRCRLPYGASNA